jgi:hypothetical protein
MSGAAALQVTRNVSHQTQVLILSGAPGSIQKFAGLLEDKNPRSVIKEEVGERDMSQSL